MLLLNAGLVQTNTPRRRCAKLTAVAPCSCYLHLCAGECAHHVVDGPANCDGENTRSWRVALPRTSPAAPRQMPDIPSQSEACDARQNNPAPSTRRWRARKLCWRGWSGLGAKVARTRAIGVCVCWVSRGQGSVFFVRAPDAARSSPLPQSQGRHRCEAAGAVQSPRSLSLVKGIL
jgi:hypothetical protein